MIALLCRVAVTIEEEICYTSCRYIAVEVLVTISLRPAFWVLANAPICRATLDAESHIRRRCLAALQAPCLALDVEAGDRNRWPGVAAH